MWRIATRTLRPGFHSPRADDVITKYFLVPALFVMTGLIAAAFIERISWKELGDGVMQMLGVGIVIVIVILGVVVNHLFFKTRPPESRPYRGRHRK